MPRDRLPMLKGYTSLAAPCGHPAPCGCEHVVVCCVECPLDECEFDRREAAMKYRRLNELARRGS